MMTDNNQAMNFYLDLFSEEDIKNEIENLKQIDMKNKSLDNTEIQEDLNTIDFKKQY